MAIEKSQPEILVELKTSLKLIELSVAHFFESRQPAYLVGISSQLRALVSFSEKHPSRSLKPLLLDMAERGGVDLSLWSPPPQPVEAPATLGAHILTSKTWSVTPRPDDVEYLFRDWLLAPAFFEDRSRRFFSRNSFIRELSEKSSVHYDREVGLVVDSLRRTTGSNLNGVEFSLLDIAAATLFCGSVLLRTLELRTLGLAAEHDIVLADIKRGFDAVRISMI